MLTSVLSLVTTFPPARRHDLSALRLQEAGAPSYGSSPIVHVAFVGNVALLVETALRFLDVGHTVSLCEAVDGRHAQDGSGRGDTTTVIFQKRLLVFSINRTPPVIPM